MQNMGTESDDTFDEMRKRVAASLMSWKNSIKDIILKGMDTGEFRKDTNAEQIALTMVAATEGAILLAKVTMDNHYLDTVLDSLKTVVKSIEES